VGLAIGSGTDVRRGGGCLVLVSRRSAAPVVAAAAVFRRHEMRNIRQRPLWAFAYNVALIPVAAGSLPGLRALLSPVLAAGSGGLRGSATPLRLRAMKTLDGPAAQPRTSETRPQRRGGRRMKHWRERPGRAPAFQKNSGITRISA